MRLRIESILALVAVTLACTGVARADTTELRIAKQFGIGYLPLVVMEHEGLIEKQAAALGIPNLKVTWARLGNAIALNDLMFSGKLDVSAGSVPVFIVLWAKTRGNPATEIMGIAGLSTYPQLLNTNKDSIRSVRDFTDADRIAMGGTKVTASAIVLQMAAEQAFGPGNAFKLDARTVSLTHPDGMIALLSKSDITAHLTAPPYQYEELKYPGIRTILNSDDVMGGKTTALMAWTTSQFRAKNPTVYRALFLALNEAVQEIKRDPKHAAELYIEDSKEKASVDNILALIQRPDFTVDMTPHNTMKYADFMKRTGTLTVAPKKFTDLFFDDMANAPGS